MKPLLRVACDLLVLGLVLQPAGCSMGTEVGNGVHNPDEDGKGTGFKSVSTQGGFVSSGQIAKDGEAAKINSDADYAANDGVFGGSAVGVGSLGERIPSSINVQPRSRGLTSGSPLEGVAAAAGKGIDYGNQGLGGLPDEASLKTVLDTAFDSCVPLSVDLKKMAVNYEVYNGDKFSAILVVRDALSAAKLPLVRMTVTQVGGQSTYLDFESESTGAVLPGGLPQGDGVKISCSPVASTTVTKVNGITGKYAMKSVTVTTTVAVPLASSAKSQTLAPKLTKAGSTLAPVAATSSKTGTSSTTVAEADTSLPAENLGSDVMSSSDTRIVAKIIWYVDLNSAATSRSPLPRIEYYVNPTDKEPATVLKAQ